MSNLRTERCFLRQWQESDFPLFAEMNADPEVVEFFPAALTTEQSDAFARRNHDSIERDGFGLWALEVEETFAGYVGLNKTAFVALILTLITRIRPDGGVNVTLCIDLLRSSHRIFSSR